MARVLFRRSLKPSDIPAALLSSALMGVVGGPFFGMFVPWLVFGSSYTFPTDWPKYIAQSSIIGGIFSISFYVTTGMPWIWLRHRWCNLSKRTGSLLGLLVSATGGLAGTILAVTMTHLVLGYELFSNVYLARLIAFEIFLTIILGAFMGTISRLQMEAQLRERKLAETAAKAQANALQAQIAPHFFFNALNSVSALIPVAPNDAQKMLWRLADLFRYSFNASGKEMVPLERELEFVREYLELEKIRYRQRLRFIMQEPNGAASVHVPGLMLQPLVENAIRHGIAHRLEGGEIRVEIDHADGHCAIAVWNQCDVQDSGVELSPDRVFHVEHALYNVRERLRLAYGPTAELSLEKTEPEWVRALIRFPLKDNNARTGS